MALIPPKYIDAVVAIGFPADHGKTQWAATGFLFGELQTRAGRGAVYNSFLVTNRHVLDKQEEVVLRFNPEAAEPAREYRSSLLDDSGAPLWTPHPNLEVDVAVFPIDGDFLISQGVRLGVFGDDGDAMFRDQAIAQGLAEGDPVFVLGFPMGLVGGDRNYVIVRQGNIARVRDWLAGAASEFLVDASIFPGNSGGPVVSGPTSTSIAGTPPPRKRCHLLGMVAGFLPWTDVAVSGQTGRARVTFEENSGLASIIPADFVRETVNAFHASNPGATPPTGDITEAPPDERTSEPTPKQPGLSALALPQRPGSPTPQIVG